MRGMNLQHPSLIGNKEESVNVSFDALPLIALECFLKNFYPAISFANYAEYDIEFGHIKLYFKSEPESFRDFKDKNIEEVELILDDRTQEHHSDEDEPDR